MKNIFTTVVKFSVILSIGIFLFNILLQLLSIIVGFLTAILGGSPKVDGAETSHAGYLIAMIIGMILSIILGLFLLKVLGAALLRTKATLNGVRKGVTNYAKDNLKRTVKNVREMGNLDSRGLRALSNLAGRDNMVGRNIRRMSNVSMFNESAEESLSKKSIKGNSGKIDKDNVETEGEKANAANAGASPEDKIKDTMQGSGLDDNMMNALLASMTKEEKEQMLDLFGGTDDMDKKRNAAQAMMAHYGIYADTDPEVAAQDSRRARGSMNHDGKTIVEHDESALNDSEIVDEAEVTGKSTAVALRDRDVSAQKVSDKFHESHSEYMDAREDADILGAQEMRHSLDISRTSEENKLAGVHGSSTDQMKESVIEDEAKRIEVAADVHNSPIDSEVARAGAEQEKKNLGDIINENVGMPADEAFKDMEKVDILERDVLGNAHSSFAGDEVQESGETLANGRAIYGNTLPASVLESGDFSEENIENQSAVNEQKYFEGTAQRSQEIRDQIMSGMDGSSSADSQQIADRMMSNISEPMNMSSAQAAPQVHAMQQESMQNMARDIDESAATAAAGAAGAYAGSAINGASDREQTIRLSDDDRNALRDSIVNSTMGVNGREAHTVGDIAGGTLAGMPGYVNNIPLDSDTRRLIENMGHQVRSDYVSNNGSLGAVRQNADVYADNVARRITENIDRHMRNNQASSKNGSAETQVNANDLSAPLSEAIKGVMERAIDEMDEKAKREGMSALKETGNQGKQ